MTCLICPALVVLPASLSATYSQGARASVVLHDEGGPDGRIPAIPGSASFYKHHFDSARVLRKAGNTYEALAHLRLACLYAATDEEKQRALFERGQAYYYLRNYHEAVLSFRIYLRKFPDSAERTTVQLCLADALFRMVRLKEALSEYEKAEVSGASLFGRANVLHAFGRYGEAHEFYMAALTRDRERTQGSQEAMYWAGENARLLGRQADAKAHMSAVKDQTLVYRRDQSLGLIAIDEADYAGAIKYCTSARNSPEREVRRKALLCLADASAKLGRAQESEAFLLQLRRDYAYGKERDRALLSLARFYRSQSRQDDALSLLKELVYRHQPEKGALDELESLLLETRDRNFAKFVALWKAVGHTLLDSSRSQELLGIAEMLRPQVKDFLDLCKWLAANGTDDVKTRCRISLSDYYTSVGDSASALLHLRNSRVNGGDDAFRVQARIAVAEGQYERSLSHLQRVKDLNRDDLSLLSEVGMHIAPNSALLSLYERALKNSEMTSEVHMEYADLLCRAGRPADSIEHYKRVIGMVRPGDASGADRLQWVRYRIATLSRGKESEETLQNIGKGGVIGRLAEVSLREMQVNEMMRRIQ